MKDVYFVRHGESESNARTLTVYRGRNSELTEKGLAQAAKIADRASRIPFDVLISSPWTRAKQTAEAIAEKTGKTIYFSELFTETRGPTSCIGMDMSDPVLEKRLQDWNDSVFRGGEKIEDGETFEELLTRAGEALAYLESRPESTILIATHGLFLKCLLARILVGKRLTAEIFHEFASASKTDNTGISIIQYGEMQHHEADSSERWRVRVFNDHAHLA